MLYRAPPPPPPLCGRVCLYLPPLPLSHEILCDRDCAMSAPTANTGWSRLLLSLHISALTSHPSEPSLPAQFKKVPCYYLLHRKSWFGTSIKMQCRHFCFLSPSFCVSRTQAPVVWCLFWSIAVSLAPRRESGTQVLPGNILNE